MKRTFLTLVLLLCSFKGPAQTLLFLGDSLTEGYGIKKEDAYPNLVKKIIKQKLGKDIKVINGGVSGSTSNDGLERLKWYIKRKPSVMLLALGANDGLRGLSTAQTKKNLIAIIKYAKSKKIKVLLAGMLMPPNYGQEYTQKFKSMYQEIQKEFQLKSMPFLLDGVAGRPQYNQKDGIHPNEAGHKILAQKVYQFLKDEI